MSQLRRLVLWTDTPNAHPLLICGEAGIGKSRLVEEFASAVRSNLRGRAIVVRCAALAGDALPFAALIQVLRQLLADSDPASYDELLGDSRPLLAPLLSELGPVEPRPPRPRATERLLLFEAVRDVFERAGQQGQTVIAAEDLHWMSPSGLELVRFLLHDPPADVHLLFTCRDLSGADSLLQNLVEGAAHENLLDVLLLEGLEPAETAGLLAAVLRGSPEPALLEQILPQAGGNPFYLKELASRLTSGQSANSPTETALSAASRAVLGALAVGAQSVPHYVLGAVSGLGEEQLDAGVRESLAVHQLDVSPDGLGYLFRHDRDRQAAYDGLLPGERVRLHARYAEVLSGRAGAADLPVLVQLAHHWLKAGNQEQALHWTVQAADAAERLGAWNEALELYQRALALWPITERRGRLDVLIRAAHMADAVADHRTGLALVDEALALMEVDEDPVAAGVLEERRAWHRLLIASSPMADCQRALDLVPESPPTRERARVLATHSRLLALSGRPGEALAPAEEALAMALTVGAAPEQVASLVSIGTAAVLTHNAERGDAVLLQACSLAEGLHDANELASAYRALLAARLLVHADLESVVRHANAGAEALRRLGIEDTCLSLCAAIAHFELGQWDDAYQRAQWAARVSHVAPSGLAGLLLTVLTSCRELRRPAFAKGQGAQEGLGLPLLAAKVQGEWLAQVHLLHDEPEQAATWVVDSLDQLKDRPEQAFSGRLLTLGMRAQADRATKGRDAGDSALVADAQSRAQRLVLRSARIRCFDTESSPDPTAGADAATWRAEASRLTGVSDPNAWAASADAWRVLGRPHQASYALLRQGEALLADRRRQRDAGPIIREGAALAAQLGSAPLLRQFELLARQAHLPLQRTAKEGDEDARGHAVLTSRERDVLRLLADGLSNRAIAEALVVSPKTVDSHVTHLLMKLGAHDRVSAAGRAQRLGLLP